MSEIKIIVTGSRTIENRKIIYKTLDSLFENFSGATIITGKDKGAEAIIAEWADLKEVKIEIMPILWNDLEAEGADVREGKFGNYNAAAPKVRNLKMVTAATHFVGFWDGTEIGTKILHDFSKRRELKTKMFIVEGDSTSIYKEDAPVQSGDDPMFD